LAASWDPALIAQCQSIAAREARAVGIHWTFGPNVDISRDPRWGRIVEGAGEDPYLGAAVAAAQVRGFQGGRLPDAEHVIAGPKHFAGYGAALGGRDYDEVSLSDADLWNLYLPPFKAAIDAGAANIMTAYMTLNGIPATGNRWLLQDVLRETWAFDGFVVSDAHAVHNLRTHGFARDRVDAAARALAAGVDMEMSTAEANFEHLPEAIEARLTDEQTINTSVRRILDLKFRLGLFDQPFVDETTAQAVLRTPEHRARARVAAARSAVLLRNEAEVLPLRQDELTSLAIIGPLADSKRDTLGPWSFAFDLEETVTIREGIERKVGSALRVEYAAGLRPTQRPTASIFDEHGGNKPEDPNDFDDASEFDRAVELARRSDVAVVVIGEWQNMIGEQAARAQLTIPGQQVELLKAVAATGTSVVLLMMNAWPVDLRWAAEHVPAIVEIWYPGTQGGNAVADLLFGTVNPGGKLPFSWPRSVGHIPTIYAHMTTHDPDNADQRYWDEPSTPLYHFGHGLSFTAFAYSNLRLDHAAAQRGATVTVSVTVTNTGSVEGDEVVQLYVHQRYGLASRPVRELKGFERITLGAGEAGDVHFRLGPNELQYWNAATCSWVVDASTWDVWVGCDSTANLATRFTLMD
jgi:beta-glucosidase